MQPNLRFLAKAEKAHLAVCCADVAVWGGRITPMTIFTPEVTSRLQPWWCSISFSSCLCLLIEFLIMYLSKLGVHNRIDVGWDPFSAWRVREFWFFSCFCFLILNRDTVLKVWYLRKQVHFFSHLFSQNRSQINSLFLLLLVVLVLKFLASGVVDF